MSKKNIALPPKNDHGNLVNKYYISGCIEVDGFVSRTCDDDAKFFTLYERDEAGFSQAVCDFNNRGSAERAQRAFFERDLLKTFVEEECFISTDDGFDYATVAMPQGCQGGAL